MRPVPKVVSADRHGHAGAAPGVCAHTGRNAVAQGKQDLVGLRWGRHILLKRDGVAVALDGLRLGKDRSIVDAVGIVMNELSQLDAGQPLDIRKVRLRQIADRADARGGQLFRRGPPDGKQRTDRQRPELLRDLMREKRMYLIRLFKVAGHFRQQLIGRDADVDREAQLGEDRIFDDVRDGDRVRIEQPRAGHVEEAFIDGNLLHNGRVAAADGDERFGVFRIQPEIRRSQHQLRAFAQRHADRLAGRNAEGLCGDGFCQNNAGALVPVAADGGRDEPQIGLPRRSAPRRFPRQKRAVDIHMKNQLLHPLTSFCSQYSISVRNLRTKNRKLANFYSVHTKRNAYAAGRREVCSVPDSSIRFSAVLCTNQMRFGLHLRTIPAGKAGGA